MRLQLHLEIPEDDSLPPAVDRTAYRVIQEGLTNSRKHAPDAPVYLIVAGDQLHMSLATAKAHVSRLLVKLNVENRVQIALLVHEEGAADSNQSP